MGRFIYRFAVETMEIMMVFAAAAIFALFAALCIRGIYELVKPMTG